MTEQNTTASRIEEYARRWFIWGKNRCSESRVRWGRGGSDWFPSNFNHL